MPCGRLRVRKRSRRERRAPRGIEALFVDFIAAELERDGLAIPP